MSVVSSLGLDLSYGCIRSVPDCETQLAKIEYWANLIQLNPNMQFLGHNFLSWRTDSQDLNGKEWMKKQFQVLSVGSNGSDLALSWVQPCISEVISQRQEGGLRRGGSFLILHRQSLTNGWKVGKFPNRRDFPRPLSLMFAYI